MTISAVLYASTPRLMESSEKKLRRTRRSGVRTGLAFAYDFALASETHWTTIVEQNSARIVKAPTSTLSLSCHFKRHLVHPFQAPLDQKSETEISPRQGTHCLAALDP